MAVFFKEIEGFRETLNWIERNSVYKANLIEWIKGKMKGFRDAIKGQEEEAGIGRD